MPEVFESGPDLMKVSTTLMNSAARAGHSPRVAQNGTGYSLACANCGGMTHLNYDGQNWNATHSAAHRLNTSECNS